MKLYDCTVAPNPRRARIFIAEKSINIAKIEIDIVGGEILKDEFRAINHFFTWLEHYLTDSKFIAGDHFTMADITALCTIDFAKWVAVEIPEENTCTLRWYDEVSSRPSAQA